MMSSIAEYGVNLATKQRTSTPLTSAGKEFVGGTVQRISAGDPDLEPGKDRNLEHSCPEVSFR